MPRDIPQYETIRDGILVELPRMARTLDTILAGNIASAVIIAEKIGAARISSVAEEKRAIRKRHDRRMEGKARAAMQAMSEGKLDEAYETRRQTSQGCKSIAELWAEIRDSLAMLPPEGPIPAELWREILGRVPSLEPNYRMLFQGQYEEAARTGNISPTQMIQHCATYVRVFTERAARLRKDERRALKHKFTIAEADLGKKGEKRERYLGMARSSIARHAQQIDMETHRQWRRDKEGWPAPNEPDDSPQDPDELTVEASPGGMPSSPWACERPEASDASPRDDLEGLSHAHGDEGVPTGAPTQPGTSAPNEPEDSSQVVVENAVELPSGAMPSSSRAGERPEATAAPLRADLDHLSPADEDEGMPPEAPTQPGPSAPNEPEDSSQAPTGQSLVETYESLRPPWLDDPQAAREWGMIPGKDPDEDEEDPAAGVPEHLRLRPPPLDPDLDPARREILERVQRLIHSRHGLDRRPTRAGSKRSAPSSAPNEPRESAKTLGKSPVAIDRGDLARPPRPDRDGP
ncbi:MAG: hypothetical protein U0800_16550 [Isosphaeraceae bacterium]